MATQKKSKGFPVTGSIITPEFRVSFCQSLIKPEVVTPKDGGDAFKKYSMVMLFEKSADITALRELAMEAIKLAWPNEKDRPRKFRPTFKDGDNGDHTNDGLPAGEKWEGYKGHIYVNTLSYSAPGVVHVRNTKVPITDEAEVYAGSWGRAQISAQAYQGEAGAGVRFYLQNYLKVRDDEAFAGAGKQKAEDAFAGFAAPAEDTWANDVSSTDSLLG